MIRAFIQAATPAPVEAEILQRTLVGSLQDDKRRSVFGGEGSSREFSQSWASPEREERREEQRKSQYAKARPVLGPRGIPRRRR
jgi:hypothetical protein